MDSRVIRVDLEDFIPVYNNIHNHILSGGQLVLQ